MKTIRVACISIVILGVVTACAGPPTPSVQRDSAADGQPPRPLKRITAAINGDPFTLSSQLNTSGGNTVPGVPDRCGRRSADARFPR